MTPLDIVGVSEIAKRTGVTRQTVTMWNHRGLLSPPYAQLACGPVWDWQEVELPQRFTICEER